MSDEEKRIAEIQARFTEAGYQWQEHIFNDSNPHNCSIKFTKETSPHYFTEHPLGDFGFGRFHRYYAWLLAEEWLNTH